MDEITDPCPHCGSDRIVDIDPSTDDAEPFSWCEQCAEAIFDVA
jgi:hypothetical protein